MATTPAVPIPKPDLVPGSPGTTAPLSLPPAAALPSATSAVQMSPPIPVLGVQLFDIKPLASPQEGINPGGAGRNPDGTAPGDFSPSY